MTVRPCMFVCREVEVLLDDGVAVRARAMVPEPRFRTLHDRQFDLGESYALGPVEGVPSRSRAPLFIAAREAWENLPEEDARFPHWEHVRHTALVKAGWAFHTQIVMDTPKDAKEHARGLRKVSEFAVIAVSGNVVDCWVAKSIASGTPGLTKEKFQEVKTKALDWIATLARTTRGELEKHSKDGGAR